MVEEIEDSGCNFDVQLLEFVVESFIRMFPERDNERREIGARDPRGKQYCRRKAVLIPYQPTYSHTLPS